MAAPLLLHIYPTFAVGGAQVRFAAIANHFGRRWRHAIVAMDGNTACRERLDTTLDAHFPDIAMRKGDTLGNVRRFRTVLKEMRPQTLVTSNWGSIEWAMANALAPLATHVHVEDGFGPEERSRQIPRRVWTRRLVLRRCTTVLPSQTLLRIATNTWRLPPARLHYVPNGIDLDRFSAVRSDPEAKPLGGFPAGPVIGTVAALRPEKNIARLLRAFHLAAGDRPGRLVIVGDGAERPALEALARDLGITQRVTFTGHQANPAATLAQWDIFALSSDTEQMPLSLLEAMASGLAVASTDVGDVRAMLPADSRAYAVGGDDAALAASLRALMADPGLCRTLGRSNRIKVAQDHGQARMFAAYADLFDGITAPTRPHPGPSPGR